MKMMMSNHEPGRIHNLQDLREAQKNMKDNMDHLKTEIHGKLSNVKHEIRPGKMLLNLLPFKKLGSPFYEKQLTDGRVSGHYTRFAKILPLVIGIAIPVTIFFLNRKRK